MALELTALFFTFQYPELFRGALASCQAEDKNSVLRKAQRLCSALSFMPAWPQMEGSQPWRTHETAHVGTDPARGQPQIGQHSAQQGDRLSRYLGTRVPLPTGKPQPISPITPALTASSNLVGRRLPHICWHVWRHYLSQHGLRFIALPSPLTWTD